MGVKVLIFLTVYIFAVAYCKFSVYEHIYTDDGDKGPLSNLCLNCICEVFGCPHQLSCSDVCGPFQITYGYWQAAFDRPDDEQEEFRKCTLNAWCAKRTVQMYMKRFLPACMDMMSQHTSGLVSACETAIILHRYGSPKCNTTHGVSPTYRHQLMNCLDRQTWATLPDHSSNT